MGGLVDGLLETVESGITSPWFYLALFAVALVDGFFPAVPSESLVITGGVYAASSGKPNLVLLMLAAAAGAFVGDHVSYLIGRASQDRLTTRLRPGTRRRKAFDWAARTVTARGGLILVVARYVPGGRTAVTMTMGAAGFPLRRFSFFAAIAALSWGVYSAMVGYLGGAAFEDDPKKGLLLGFGLALTITVVVEAVRHLRNRRRRAAVTGEPAPDRAVKVDAG